MSMIRRRLMGSVPGWMVTAVKTYGIPLANLVKAYGIDNEIAKSFNGTGRWLVGDGTAYIDTGYPLTFTLYFDVESKTGYFGNFTGSDSSTLRGPGILIWGNRTSANNYAAVVNDKWVAKTASSTEIHHSILNNKVLTIKDNDSNTVLTATNTVTLSLSIFLAGGHGTGGNVSKAGYFGICHFKDTNKESFFIPMTKDSVNGMYDLIGQQFYVNANSSGTFTIE